MSDYQEGQSLDALPATMYLGLSTSAPTEAGGVTEPVGNAYARVAVTKASQLSANTADAADGSTYKQNTVQVQFPNPTGAGWGACTHYFWSDAASGGNMLDSGQILDPATGNPTTLNVGPNQPPRFAVGALKIKRK